MNRSNGFSSSFSIARVCRRLTRVSVRHPGVTIALTLVTVGLMIAQAAGLRKEVGYASYFGPDDPRIVRLSSFLEEFQSGIHLLVVWSCHEATSCESIESREALGFIGRLQARMESLTEVRRTWSLLNSPIVTGPLETRTLGTPALDGGWQLAQDWKTLLALARQQKFITSSVLSTDAKTTGIVVELQSVQSDPMRTAVRDLRAILPAFEAELGSTIYMAGDPVWTVLSADSLERDSNLLTGLMFVAMLILLWLIFRDASLSVLPVLSVGALFAIVQGLTATLGIPLTSVLAALPPLVVVIAMTSSIHLVSAALRAIEAGESDPLERAAQAVGPGCFWSSVTTALGFLSFTLSDLLTIEHFGVLAAAGLLVSFVITFTLLPCLLSLRLRVGAWRPPPARASVPAEFLKASFSAVTQAPTVVLAASALVLVSLILGLPRIHYASDFGFGEDSYVFRSLRFIESNLRRPMTTEVVVTIPDRRTIYEPESLEIIHRVEEIFEREESSGGIWSILDLLEEAYRVDRGKPPASFAELEASAKREMALVSGLVQAPSYWSVRIDGEGGAAEKHRARISVDRGWLDDRAQGPYVKRIRAQLAALQNEYSSSGYRVQMEGGLLLADLFVNRLRDTQRASFLSAFLIVTLTLALLLRGDLALLGWAIAANVFPVLALLGLMGWARIGIDPANTMVGAILLVIAVDDTIHIALRYLREKRAGAGVIEALDRSYHSVGEAVVVSSLCLAVGFSVMVFSQWGGLMWFGMLASLGVVLALLGDLLLLPAGLVAPGARARGREEAQRAAR